MIYVDKNLCTGCGICLEACARGAISLDGSTAHIDEALCTSCGRCVDLCMTGAIISMEITSEGSLESVSGGRPGAVSSASTAPLVPSALREPGGLAGAAAPAQPVFSARRDLAERAISVLLGIASYLLEKRQARLTSQSASGAEPYRRWTGPAATDRPYRGSGGMGGGRGGRGGGRGRQGAQGRCSGRYGRGGGSGRGCGNSR